MKTLSISIICSSICISASAQQKPNVIIIIADGMQQNKMSFLGNTDLYTPSMDRLGDAGYTFTNAYCTFPLSTPVRFALMTGMYPSDYNLRFNLENKEKVNAIDWAGLESAKNNSIGNLFKKAGYDTFYGGTTSLASKNGTGNVNEYGFEYYYSKERHEQLGKDAVSIIRSRKNDDKPYLLVASFINPHNIGQFGDYLKRHQLSPEEITPKKKEGIDRIDLHMSKINGISEEIRLSEIYPSLPKNNSRMYGEPENLPTPISHYSINQWRQFCWLYNRLIEEIDYNITPIMDELLSTGQLNNTIVVFLADHGEMASSHLREHKNEPFEEDQKVPFIIAGPEISKGIIDRDNIINTGIDFLPTICELAGVRVPKGLPGISLKETLTHNSKISRKFIFCEGPNWFQVIENGRYKYTVIEDNGEKEEMLTDLKKDPDEMYNMAKSIKYIFIRSRLNKTLQKELKRRKL